MDRRDRREKITCEELPRKGQRQYNQPLETSQVAELITDRPRSETDGLMDEESFDR